MKTALLMFVGVIVITGCTERHPEKLSNADLVRCTAKNDEACVSEMLYRMKTGEITGAELVMAKFIARNK